LEDWGIDGRMGSEWILGRLAGGCKVDSVGSGWGWWQAVVNKMMNVRVLAPRVS
jgi:hypothetical protein